MALPKGVQRAIERQWSIMPLRLDKKPYLSSWKRLQTERASVKEIEAWQKKYNPPAWGLICGAISGLFVTDHDEYAPGAITLADLGLQGREDVVTVNGGKHVYWPYPGYNVPTLNSQSAKRITAAGFKGFDIRGDGGYVVFWGTCEKKLPEGAPEGTAHERGRYRWIKEPDPTLTPDLLPEKLRDALRFWPADVLADRFPGEYEKPATASAPAPPPQAAPPQQRGRKKPFEQWALDKALERQGDGRNAAGFWLAAQLRDEGWSERAAADFIASEYRARVKDTNTAGRKEPYTEAEARKSTAQAFQRPAREPLTTKAEAAAGERAQAQRDREQFHRNADAAQARNRPQTPEDLQREIDAMQARRNQLRADAGLPPEPEPEPEPDDDDAPDIEEASARAWQSAAEHTAAATALAKAPEPEPEPAAVEFPGSKSNSGRRFAAEPGTMQRGAHLCPYTDLGNAERLLIHYRGTIRYCKQMDRWFTWDQKRMRMDETAQVHYLAQKTARSLWEEIKYSADSDDRDERIKHARKSEGGERIRAMVQQAQPLPDVPVRSQEIDAHPWLLNVWNGTVDLKLLGTGRELREHRRADFITKIIKADYDPTAKCPEWLKFLNLIMDGNQGLIRYLQTCVGYCLTGDISERALFVPWGSGANGKSTFLIAIHELLGEYAMKTPASTLVNRRENAIPNDIARLQGARFVYASETKEGCKLSEDTIKELTGGEVLTARFMRGEFFEFSPNFKLWLATNHKPIITGTDKGIWDRIKLIPFIVRIPDVIKPEDAISRETVLQRFREEAAGILAWALEGTRLYLEAGRVPEPVEVTTATNAYREDMDTLAQFLEEYTEQTNSPDYTVRAGVLYDCFKEWAKENGEYEISQKVFSNRILERGYIRKRTPAGKVFQQLKLKKAPKVQTLQNQQECTDMYGDESFSDIRPGNAPHVEGMPKSRALPGMTVHSDEEIEL